VKYATNLGCYISTNTINNNTGPFVGLNFSPQIEQPNAVMLADILNWIRINGTYKASGGEQYITIGNFNDNTTIDTMSVLISGTNGAFYYTDDFTLKLIPNNISSVNAGSNQAIVQGDSVQIGNNPMSDAVYTWYPSAGLNDTTLENPIAKPTVTTTYYCIKDACNSQTIDSVTVTVNPNSVNEFEDGVNVILYPNPNNGSFRLTHNLDNENNVLLKIIDITGKVVFKKNIDTTNDVIKVDAKKLNTGMYFITLIDINQQLIYNSKISIIK